LELGQVGWRERERGEARAPSVIGSRFRVSVGSRFGDGVRGKKKKKKRRGHTHVSNDQPLSTTLRPGEEKRRTDSTSPRSGKGVQKWFEQAA
jgi:hypothetical protein